MALCDRLEASFDPTAANRRRLLDAILAEALALADECEREAAEYPCSRTYEKFRL